MVLYFTDIWCINCILSACTFSIQHVSKLYLISFCMCSEKREEKAPLVKTYSEK